MSVLLITGQSTGGKTSLGRYLQECGAATLVSGDQHRYVPGSGWTKRPLEDYIRSVDDALENAKKDHPGRLIAFETSVCDVSDPEDARGECARRLCARGLVRQVLVFEMDSDRLNLGVVTRVMRRAAGVEPQNPACNETPKAVTRLLAKIKKVPFPMEPFLAAAAGMGVPVARTPAIPLPEPWDTKLTSMKEPLQPTLALLQTLLPDLRL